MTQEDWDILNERKITYRSYLQDRNNSQSKDALTAINRLAKKVVREAKERAVNTALKEFENLKELGSLREAYVKLKGTLRNVNISWFDRGRFVESRPSNRAFQQHYAKLFETVPHAPIAEHEQGESRNSLTLSSCEDAIVGSNHEVAQSEVYSRLCERDDGGDGDETDCEITSYEVEAAISRSRSHKAPGKSGITIDLIKAFKDLLISPLTDLFQTHWENPSSIPSAYKDAKVVSIHKKGDKMDTNNYRSIFLLDSVGKVFCRIAQRRLCRVVEAGLDKYQFGFRGGRGTAQAIWALRMRIQKAREDGRVFVSCLYRFGEGI